MILKHKYCFILVTILFGFNILEAQEVTVPTDVQLELLTKVLSLDKSINNNDPEEVINLGILYCNKQRSSVNIKNEISKLALEKELKINLAKIILIPIEISNIKNLKIYFSAQNLKALYLTPLRGHDISMISNICKKNKIITYTGVSSFVENNDISVGFGLEKNKLQITINLESAKAEGAKFSSRLLKISRVK